MSKEVDEILELLSISKTALEMAERKLKGLGLKREEPLEGQG